MTDQQHMANEADSWMQRAKKAEAEVERLSSVRKEDAAFLNKVADLWSRAEGDAPGNEGIWALKLRAIAKSFSDGPSAGDKP